MQDKAPTPTTEAEVPIRDPAEVAEIMRREERAERFRERYRSMPGFLDLLRERREAAEAGTPIPLEETLRKYNMEDEFRAAVKEANGGEPDATILPELMRRQERAEQIRHAFMTVPGFLESLQQADEDIKAGRLISFEEIKRKYQFED
jgi:hypothetical protein